MRALWGCIVRQKPEFEVFDDVEFTAADMYCPNDIGLTVIEVTYYPFGYYGTILDMREPEYRYAVQAWDGRLFTDLRASRLAKRD